MPETQKIFEALMMEACSDVRSAKLLLDGGEFSRSIYHSQQAIEKAMKASLALKGAIITDDHWVSDRFLQAFPEMPGINNLIRESKYLERQAIKSRYPLFTNPDKPIWIPSQEYSYQDANDAYKKTITIVKNIIQFLKEKHGISFEIN
ncbi:MAG: HEPN domain-containing protein [Candidatus Methanoperedens sp.]|nr:HEPN domain-containing protein [Candidatus Methanoperedens sp.]